MNPCIWWKNRSLGLKQACPSPLLGVCEIVCLSYLLEARNITPMHSLPLNPWFPLYKTFSSSVYMTHPSPPSDPCLQPKYMKECAPDGLFLTEPGSSHSDLFFISTFVVPSWCPCSCVFQSNTKNLLPGPSLIFLESPVPIKDSVDK